MAPKLVSNMYDCMFEFQCHSSLDSWSSDASTGRRDTAVTPQVNTVAEAGAMSRPQFCGHIEPPNSSQKSHSGAHARANFSTNFNNPCLKLQMMF